MCQASNEDQARQCRRCQADLSLLADYVSHLQGGLEQAELLTRAGELGEAVWAYLAVLEVDPDNATARRQVGKVVTAVRQFDETAPGRRWLTSLRKKSWWRRWLASDDNGPAVLLAYLLAVGVLVGCLALGYSWGYWAGQNAAPPMLSVEQAEQLAKEKAEQEKADAERRAHEEREKKERKIKDDAGLLKPRP
jgi:type VI protein secretion system component VasK